MRCSNSWARLNARHTNAATYFTFLFKPFIFYAPHLLQLMKVQSFFSTLVLTSLSLCLHLNTHAAPAVSLD
jgi:hypothetical protein